MKLLRVLTVGLALGSAQLRAEDGTSLETTINQLRQEARLEPLVRSRVLDCAAQSHAVAMARSGQCRPVAGGKTVFQRIKDCGVTEPLTLGAAMACNYVSADQAIKDLVRRRDGYDVVYRAYSRKGGYGWYAGYWVFVSSDQDISLAPPQVEAEPTITVSTLD